MTLLDAKEFDEQKARTRRTRIVLIVVVLVIIASLLWWFRFWPQEHTVGRFFEAVQKQDYKTAYGIWQHDPEWEKHPGQYPKYQFNDFYRDWGPGGEWGLVKSYRVYGASKCPTTGGSSGTGVVVDVVVNDRTQHAQVWVENSDRTLSYPPCELIFR
jgi:hypothetical protein